MLCREQETVFYPHPVVDIHVFIAFGEILNVDIPVYRESKSYLNACV